MIESFEILRKRSTEKALSRFMKFDCVKIQDQIKLAPDDRDVILKKFRTEAIEKFQNSIFSYERDIDINIDTEHIKIIIERLDLAIAQGDDLSQYIDLPADLLEHPAESIKQLLIDAIRQKLIIDYCNSEIQGTPLQKEYYKFNDSVLMTVFDISTDIFLCDNKTFVEMVHRGNLSVIKIAKGGNSRAKHLVYKLSIYIGDDWYSCVCNSLDWKKSECSKTYDLNSHNKWGHKIEKIIPRDLFAI